MVLDILIAAPILLMCAVGFRDGLVRKLVAIAVMILGLFFGQIFRQDVGKLLIEHLHTDPSDAPVLGYIVIFLGLFFLQALLYRLMAGKYKIGGFADRAIGSALGFFEGMLFTSALFFILLPTGFPSRDLSKYSHFYKSVVNIAPKIMDVESALNTDSIEESLGIKKDKKTPSE